MHTNLGKWSTMEGTVKPRERDQTKMFNKIGYWAFVLLGLYFLVFSKDTSQGIANLGIALIFDPFDQKQPFGERPLVQKAWLLLHVSVTIGLLAYTLVK